MRSRILAGIFCVGMAVTAMAGAQPSEQQTTVRTDRDDDSGKWGLAGLVGLVGLLGLKRRDNDVRVGTTRTANTTAAR